MNYLFDEKLYTDGPMTFKLPEPVKVKLKDLDNFLDKLAPYNFTVFMIEHFQYGDFGNYVTAVVRDKTISPKYSNFSNNRFCIKTDFWYICNRKFWHECPQVGYHDEYNKTFDELEVEVSEVFIIANKDFY